MAEENDEEKYNFWNFRSPVTLTLTLDWVIRHTDMHQSSTSIYIPNYTKNGNLYGRTDIRTHQMTDGHFPL